MSIISDWQAIINGFDFTYIINLVVGVIPSLICICIHELSHGYVALRLGDDTAKIEGRLTLNPLRHLDPVGLVMMLLFHVGWARPVPVKMSNFKNPKRDMALTALAGPLSNIITSVIALFIYGLVYLPLYESTVGNYVLIMLQLMASIGIGLAVFNCIPVPPLDGSKILFSLVSEDTYSKLLKYDRYVGPIMFLLVFSGILGKPLSLLVNTIFDKMFVIAQLGFKLALSLM